MNRRFTTAMLAMAAALFALPAWSAERTEAQMKAAAAKAIGKQLAAQRKAPRRGELRLLQKQEHFSVMGYDEGGFAIVTNNDLLPEVLGYSDEQFYGDKDNCAFQWWLQAMEEATDYYVKNNKKPILHAPGANTNGSCRPLLRTKWGQTTPYNNMCPAGKYSGSNWQEFDDDTLCVTGCVATALAQCMKYNQYPLHGQGTHSVRVKQNSGTNKFIVNYDEAVYDWDNMLDDYTDGYTEEQADAVAQLMYHVGVACDMSYAIDGSGAYMNNATKGLVRNFGYPSPKSISSGMGSSKKWMDKVYQELDKQYPLCASGADWVGGHAWVLDGYDEEGFVHCNWGWNGRDDGYYSLSLLDPEDYSFTMQLGFYGNIVSPDTEFGTDTLEVTLTEAGTLNIEIPEDSLLRYTSLKVSGPINSSDFKIIRHMAGRNASGAASLGRLTELDLSDAQIVAGGEPYMTIAGQEYTTTDNQLPFQAFFSCTHLRQLALPDGLQSIGQQALSLTALESLRLSTADGSDIVYEDGQLYNANHTELIQVLPFVTGDFQVPSTVKLIHSYAFAGCQALETIDVPLSVDSIAPYSIYDCGHLKKLTVHRQQPIAAGKRNFVSLGKDCTLYLPTEGKEAYEEHDVWSIFFTSKNYKYKLFEEEITAIHPVSSATAATQPFDVYTLQGRLVKSSTTTLTALPAGLYIIRQADGTSHKVMLQ